MIKHGPYIYTPLCSGSIWTIQDEDALAKLVAIVLLGKYQHAQIILSVKKKKQHEIDKKAAHSALKLLSFSSQEEKYHRDGLVFQILSWIAAQIAFPASVISPPHLIRAHKGLDGILIDLDQKTGQLSSVIVFEDKATENPRATIRDEVWPDFKSIEEGTYRNLITQETATLLISQTLFEDNGFALSDTEYLASINVMTPEKCLALISFDPQMFEEVALLVFDECHLLHPNDQYFDRRSVDAMLQYYLRLADTTG